ncbi:uncharacterized protein [Palaemon carinicauda]|uniref:uncharacterized protein n=1 Tax=Palaemon carinicauda TaxID=392227 RepID=UPI0035B5EF62
MFGGSIIVVCCIVAMDLGQLASSQFLFKDRNHDQFQSLRKGRAAEDEEAEKFTFELEEDLISNNESLISIEFPLTKNNSSEEQLLSIVEKTNGEFDIEAPFVVNDQIRNIVYSIFPEDWKDENVCPDACNEGEPLTDCCKELLENEKRCPKQSRVCVLELGTANTTMEECSGNSNCSTGHRCCFDRCTNVTMCKPERPVPQKPRLPSFVDGQIQISKDGKVDIAQPITLDVEEEKKKYTIFPEDWSDNEHCQLKCSGNNGTLECCTDTPDRQKLCPRSRRLCVIDLDDDIAVIDRCENDENCSEGQKCCYDRCHGDTVCKKVRRKKDY